MENVNKNWIDLCKRYSDNIDLINEWFDVITNAYNQKHRHYHNLEHILSMTQEIIKNQEVIKEMDTLLFATWFHDIIYDPKKKNNEMESANIAEKALKQLLVPTEKIEKIKSLIQATANHVANKSDQTSDLSFFLDCDLKILGSTQSEYLKYSDQIRKEYNFVPALLYNFERKKILKRFIQSDHIYRTVWFRDKYEQEARLNISNEIQTL